MENKNLSKEQLLDLLKMTVDGWGIFPKNRAIYYFVQELTGKYFYSKEDLFNNIVEYIIENNIEHRNNTSTQ